MTERIKQLQVELEAYEAEDKKLEKEDGLYPCPSVMVFVNGSYLSVPLSTSFSHLAKFRDSILIYLLQTSAAAFA